MFRFDVIINWPISDEHNARLSVSGTYDSSPGNRRGHPDTWTPAWSEVNVERIICEDSGAPLPLSVVHVLSDDEDFISAVEGAVTRPQYP